MSRARIGQEIAGKYRLVRLLGEGGMGAVYEAQHTLIGRRVAIKFLHPASASSADTLARFKREAQAAGSLESENIAAVMDFGTAEDGSAYLVMEYLSGEDFSRLLAREGSIPIPRLVDVIIQACRGLHAAHGAGIVHRDLKPENLFIARRGDGSDLVKVLDFGIAKLRTAEGEGTTTQTGTTMGTPHYMPPEQARGDKNIDERADVYSLGVILYEALSGSKPHPGDSYNAILYHILSKPPAPLESLRPGIPAELAAVVHRALAFEPTDRFASVGELTQALVPFGGRAITPFQSNVTVDSAPSTRAAVTIDTPPSIVGAHEPTEPLPQGPAQSPAPAPTTKRTNAGLLAALMLALAGAGALVVSKSNRREGNAAPSASVGFVPATTSAASAILPATSATTAQPVEPAPSSEARTSSAPLPIASVAQSARRAPAARTRTSDPSAAPPAGPPRLPSAGGAQTAAEPAPKASSVRSFVGDRL